MSEARGSEILRARWEKGGFQLSEDLIKKLVAVTGNLVLDHVFIKGQPRPDFLHASLSVDGEERCGTAVQGLLQSLGRLGVGPAGRVVVFPKGVPVDRYTIELQIGMH